MRRQFSIQNHKGFTLIEMISIMIILGVLGSVGVKKYDNFTHTASEQILTTAVYELNTREKLIWLDMKISIGGYTNDADVYAALAYYHDHREEIRRQIREDEAFAREMQAQNPSLLQQKLKQKNA